MPTITLQEALGLQFVDPQHTGPQEVAITILLQADHTRDILPGHLQEEPLLFRDTEL